MPIPAPSRDKTFTIDGNIVAVVDDFGYEMPGQRQKKVS